jgi:hypothetical protein
MFKYETRSLLFKPNKDVAWCSHYAGASFVKSISDNTLRVFFSGTASDRVSRIGYFDISANLDTETVSLSPNPIFDVGDIGCFDENGMTYPFFVKIDNDTVFMYYAGWIKGGIGGAITAIGLAISHDNGQTFKRVSKAPIFGRTNEEPISTATPFVLKQGNLFRMWYTCINRWDKLDGKPYHFYNIKYAESDDGIHWKRNLSTAIDFSSDMENCIAKPYIIVENGLYKMWYCYRRLDTKYKIGYAESHNGIKWTRKDNLICFPKSEPDAWDSEMQEYPFIYAMENGDKYCFYCGNDYGRTGIGVVAFY